MWRLGEEPDAPWVFSSAPRHAHIDGFDLHANVAVPAGDRTRLEELCRYLLRPAVSQDRLRLLADGRILLTLKTAWGDGTRQLLFEPVELLEKLAALTPRPRINLVLYHGVLAPHAQWRGRGVAYGPGPAATAPPPNLPDSSREEVTAEPTHRHWPWAKLMRRAFEIDVLACLRCGGRLRLIATVEDPREIREVLGRPRPLGRARGSRPAVSQAVRRQPYLRRLRLIAQRLGVSAEACRNGPGQGSGRQTLTLLRCVFDAPVIRAVSDGRGKSGASRVALSALSLGGGPARLPRRGLYVVYAPRVDSGRLRHA